MKQKTYKFEYIGLIEIKANNEDLAYKKFDKLPNETLGKYVHSVEVLQDD
jgi:hypothetical protein